jgi:hypothetical protein
MTDADLIATFLAKNEPTVVPMGARTMSNSQMKRAIGWEPDVVVKREPKIYEVIGSNGKTYYHNEQGEWL